MTKGKQSSNSLTNTLKHSTVQYEHAIWSIEVVENLRHDTWSRAARVARNGEAWGEVRRKHNGLLVTMVPYGKIIPTFVLKLAERNLT